MRFSIHLFTVSLLCFLLHASATHYAPTLRHYFSQHELKDKYQGLWPAAKEGASTQALKTLVERASISKDVYWLEQAASLNSLSAQLALAGLKTGDEKQHWWQQAAKSGHGPSQFELSLLEDSIEQRIRYLEQAAFNQHAPAIIALSKYYYEEKNVDKAIRWLAKAAEFDHNSSFTLGRMYWKQGDKEKATKTFKSVSELSPDANEYYKTIHQIKPSKLSMLNQQRQAIPNQCAQYIQFVATSLDSAVQAKRFKASFENDRRLTSLAICIAPIIWLQANQLKCKLNNERQSCDLTSLAQQTFTPHFTHVVFFLEKGKAYVQNGAMYLDETDTYSVFVHELAHFVGFVDEYAVSAELAEQYCRETTAPNLMIANEADLQSNDGVELWQGLIQEINQQRINAVSLQPSQDIELLSLKISTSRTCNKLDVSAYKPSNEITFLEFHDANNIPPIYLHMWEKLLSKHYQDIAVSELFLQQAQSINDQQAIQYWDNY